MAAIANFAADDVSRRGPDAGPKAKAMPKPSAKPSAESYAAASSGSSYIAPTPKQTAPAPKQIPQPPPPKREGKGKGRDGRETPPWRESENRGKSTGKPPPWVEKVAVLLLTVVAVGTILGNTATTEDGEDNTLDLCIGLAGKCGYAIIAPDLSLRYQESLLRVF